ncbi:MAG: murein biosynthesis integral membrane protein MurJ, partial [Raoultibacter sp.]
YLAVFALSLPFYAVNTYLQKVYSSLRKMTIFAVFSLSAAAVQVGLTIGAAIIVTQGIATLPIESIAYAELAFYLVSDICLFIYLRKRFGAFGLRSTMKAFASALLLGLLGAAAGGGLLFVLELFVAPLSGSIVQAFGYIVVCGLVSLVVTFGIALKLKIPEAAFLSSIFARVGGKLKRR